MVLIYTHRVSNLTCACVSYTYIDDFHQAVTAPQAQLAKSGWKPSKVLGIVTMVYQCSTIQALYTD